MAETYGKDGRYIINPPCEFGHTRQAMECPSCSERKNGTRASTEWWAWYRKRRGGHGAVNATAKRRRQRALAEEGE